MRSTVRGSLVRRTTAGLLCVMLAVPAAAQEATPSPAPSPSPVPPPSPAPPAAAKVEPGVKSRGFDDQRRTIRSYPSNLAYNTVGVLTKGNYGPIALMFAAVTAWLVGAPAYAPQEILIAGGIAVGAAVYIAAAIVLVRPDLLNARDVLLRLREKT